MENVITVENISKLYYLGPLQRHSESLRESITSRLKNPSRWISSRGRERQELWALKDLSFTVGRGEILGIIGRNGAGKSTLLKILSRIVEPTEGRVLIDGRIGSLLEVGTGFHPELTGRENIFLNGAILGMSRKEIERKFDEIVAFSEIEKFINTAVKYYSSGMYVRLAFAVAAHLEPDILILDEVLAVGDAAFQRKCLGKMEDVQRHGRTVLFVSHNMAAVRSLCHRVLLLKDGRIVTDSDAESSISDYFSETSISSAIVEWDRQAAPQTPEIRFVKGYILNSDGKIASALDYRKPFSIVVEYEVLEPIKNLRVGFFMQNSEGIAICGSNDPDAWPEKVRNEGHYISKCDFPGYTLNSGTYLINFGSDRPPFGDPLVTTPFCLSFVVEDMEGHGSFNYKMPGVLRPKVHWDVALRDGLNSRAEAKAVS